MQSSPTNGKPGIQKWRPIHDEIVLLHMAGYANNAIAARVGRSEVMIGQFILSRRAKKEIESIRARMLEKADEHLEGRIVKMAGQALDRIQETMDEDFEAGTTAKVHQDRSGFKLLELAGMKRDRGEAGSSGLLMSREQSERLVQAMEKSTEATRIHEMPETPAEVIDANSP